MIPGRLRVLSGFLVALALAACTSTRSAGPALAGRWMPVHAELGGQEYPVENFDGAFLVMTKDSYEFAGDQGTYTVITTSPPATMYILGREGPNAGRTIQAIYELEGEELTVCYQLGSGERPEAFESPEGSQVLLIHYRRAP